MTITLLATALSDATLRANAILASPAAVGTAIKDFVLARFASDDRGPRKMSALGTAQVVPIEVAVSVLPDERPYAL